MLFGPGVKAETDANSVNDRMVGKSIRFFLIGERHTYFISNLISSLSVLEIKPAGTVRVTNVMLRLAGFDINENQNQGLASKS